MDEPLASLDTERASSKILPLIESLRDELHIPIVTMFDAVNEVARLASGVVVLENGHVVAAGSVEDVFGPGLRVTGVSRFARLLVVTGKLAAVDAEDRPHRDCAPGAPSGSPAGPALSAARHGSSSRRPTSRSPLHRRRA